MSALIGILAGGLGTRLNEHSAGLPKAMVTVAGAPLLHWTFEQIERTCPDAHVVVLAGHRSEAIVDFVECSGWRSRLAGLDVDVRAPAGTAAALEVVLEIGADDYGVVVTCNADTLVDIDVAGLAENHSKRQESDCTVAVTTNPGALRQGLLLIESERLCPSAVSGPMGLVASSTGWIAWSPNSSRLAGVAGSSIEHDVLPHLAAEGRVAVLDLGDEPCIDCGTPDRLEVARSVFGHSYAA